MKIDRCAEEVPGGFTRKLLNEAKRRLSKDFLFVGLTEEWDVSICLFHQMLGGHARAVEFLNTRAGKSQPVALRKTGKTLSNSPLSSTSSSPNKKYDEIVLASKEVQDKVDEATYKLAKKIFIENLKIYATCPDKTKYPISHIIG